MGISEFTSSSLSEETLNDRSAIDVAGIMVGYTGVSGAQCMRDGTGDSRLL
jgi:hypothetical protein